MANQTRPKSGIVIFSEKHGRFAYDIKKSGGWQRICMAIVQERHEQGTYYREPPVEKPTPPEAREVSSLEDALQVQKEWRQYKSELDYYNSDHSHWKLLQAALNGSFDAAVRLIQARGAHPYRSWEEREKYKDDPEMLKWLDERSGYQYETYEVIDLETIPDTTPRYVQTGREATLELALALETRLFSPRDYVQKDRAKLEAAVKAAMETTTEPTDQPHIDNDSDCPLQIGWEGFRNRMVNLANKFLKYPDNWWIQDEVRWECARLLPDHERTRLAKSRVALLGSAEAVGRKRFEDFIELGTRKTAEEHADWHGETVDERLSVYTESTRMWLRGEPHMGVSLNYRTGLKKRK